MYYISWAETDNNHAKATIDYCEISASGIITFDDNGAITSFTTEDRANIDTDGNMLKVKWSAICGDYKDLNLCTYKRRMGIIIRSNEKEKAEEGSLERKAMAKTEHKTEVRVIYADTDAMSVVYHSNYFKWFEVGRTELLRSIGYPYARLEQDGFMLPIAECGCKYIQPARYDDVLEITTFITEVKAATIIIEYEIYRKSTGKKLVTGFTRHAVINNRFKPVSLRKVAPDLYELLINTFCE